MEGWCKMGVLSNLTRSLQEQREYENAVAAVAKQEAMIEYLAIMNDCEEILEDNETESEVSEDE